MSESFGVCTSEFCGTLTQMGCVLWTLRVVSLSGVYGTEVYSPIGKTKNRSTNVSSTLITSKERGVGDGGPRGVR